MTRSKNFLWLNILILSLLFWVYILDALLSGNITHKYTCQCQEQTCQVQTTALFGFGKNISQIDFARNAMPKVKYSARSKMPYYYIIINNQRLPLEFYFADSAAYMIAQIQSDKNFTTTSYSLLLRYFLLVLGIGWLISSLIIFFKKKS